MGIAHVMDSRSVAFADEVMAATGGEGVDVILNSLAGDAIPKGLSILRPYGRFVEMGKRDIYADSPIGLLPFDRNLSFSSIALERICLDRPAFVGSMLREIAALIADRALEPIPHTAFDLAEAEHALRFLAQAKHIGKLVLTVRQPSYQVAPCAERPICRPDATYVISGGLGGLGLAVARWLVDCGARHLVLMSRRGMPIPENQAALDALRASAAEVVIVAGDVSREADVRRMLDEIRTTLPPVRGIVHGAMVLDDVLVPQLTAERLEAVLAPKIGGAWNLHLLTAADDLDFFVMFSSGMSQLGTKWQGNYAAANVFLDVLAPYRRSLGLPALTVNWGAIGEVGYVSRHGEIAQHLQRQGMDTLTPAEALGWLEDAIRLGFANLTVARMDWLRWSSVDPKAVIVKKTRRLAHLASAEQTTSRDAAAESGALLPVLAATPPAERQAVLVGHVVERVARVLGTSPKKVDAERPLTEMGVDSLMAVELQAMVNRDFGVSLSLASLLEGVTVRQLTATLLDQLDLEATAPEPVGASHQPASPAEHEGDEAPTTVREEVLVVPPRQVPAENADRVLAGTAVAAVDAPAAAPPVLAVAVADRLSEPALPPAPPMVGRPLGTVDYATIDYSRWSPPQRIGQALFRMLFRIAAPIDVEGLENIPRSGPVLLAVNHLSMLDLPLLVTVLPRRSVCIATESLRRFPWLRWFLDLGDSIYVRRGEADQQALTHGLAVLRAGGVLGVAPEGTRSRTGGLTRGHSGVAYLATEAQAPILPIVAYGQEQVVNNLKRLRRTRVHVRIGSLMHAAPGEKTAARLHGDTERVMTALAEMLPPAYRGVYADAVERS
jgi:1-acyl-sn-glycerol-3-phosphate acyltransferase